MRTDMSILELSTALSLSFRTTFIPATTRFKEPPRLFFAPMFYRLCTPGRIREEKWYRLIFSSRETVWTYRHLCCEPPFIRVGINGSLVLGCSPINHIVVLSAEKSPIDGIVMETPITRYSRGKGDSFPLHNSIVYGTFVRGIIVRMPVNGLWRPSVLLMLSH